MDQNDLIIPFPQLVSTLSDAVDLISPVLNNHHKQVAYISHKIAREINLYGDGLADLITAALLHDIGALSLDERMDLLEFEEKNPYVHTTTGSMLLKDLEIFNRAGNIILHHHLPWRDGAGKEYKGEHVSLESHILYLADRIAVSIDSEKEILNQVEIITNRIKKQANSRFHPMFVDIFEKIGKKEAFWLDLVSPSIDARLDSAWQDCDRKLDLKGLQQVTKIFARVIDFRSRFTSVHSSGVGAVAEIMAKKIGWSDEDCIKMVIAGNLHDLGKLAVPNWILEKPGKLTEEEYNIMKTHAYLGYHLLDKVEGLEEINEYCSYHHERMDGGGYPFQKRAQELRDGSRIMAVADVMTAITEDRPYRKGMDSMAAMRIIEKMGHDGKLDIDMIKPIKENFGAINYAREKAQEQAASEYKEFGERTDSAKDYYCQ